MGKVGVAKTARSYPNGPPDHRKGWWRYLSSHPSLSLLSRSRILISITVPGLTRDRGQAQKVDRRSDGARLVTGCHMPIGNVALRGPTWKVRSLGHDYLWHAATLLAPRGRCRRQKHSLVLGGPTVLLSLYLRACGGGEVPRVTARAPLSSPPWTWPPKTTDLPWCPQILRNGLKCLLTGPGHPNTKTPTKPAGYHSSLRGSR